VSLPGADARCGRPEPGNGLAVPACRPYRMVGRPVQPRVRPARPDAAPCQGGVPGRCSGRWRLPRRVYPAGQHPPGSVPPFSWGARRG